MTIDTVTMYQTLDGKLHKTWHEAELHDLKIEATELFNSCILPYEEGLDVEEVIKALRTDRTKALRFIRFAQLASGISASDIAWYLSQ